MSVNHVVSVPRGSALASTADAGPLPLVAAHPNDAAGLLVSARADYSIRALLALTDVYAIDPDRLVKAQTLAREQGIPSKFLEAILTQLRHEGLVHSQRGKVGGFRLAREPGRITLAEIIQASHAPLVGFRSRRSDAPTESSSTERLGDVWTAVRFAMLQVLAAITLADVAAGRLPSDVDALAGRVHDG